MYSDIFQCERCMALFCFACLQYCIPKGLNFRLFGDILYFWVTNYVLQRYNLWRNHSAVKST